MISLAASGRRSSFFNPKPSMRMAITLGARSVVPITYHSVLKCKECLVIRMTSQTAVTFPERVVVHCISVGYTILVIFTC